MRKSGISLREIFIKTAPNISSLSGNNPTQPSHMGESPSLAQLQNQQNQQNRDQQYLAKRVAHQGLETASYKTQDSAGKQIALAFPPTKYLLHNFKNTQRTFARTLRSNWPRTLTAKAPTAAMSTAAHTTLFRAPSSTTISRPATRTKADT